MKSLNRREFHKNILKGFGAVATASTVLSHSENAQAKTKQKPNIIFICSDQHSHKYAGFAGHDLVKTPNLDKIARQGVVFKNNYSHNPICVPGRSSLMTGMYASDCNSYCNSTVWDGSHPTWGTLLQKAGYYTWATGKMDLNDAHDMGFVQESTKNGHCTNPDITSLFRRPCIYRNGHREKINGEPRQKRNNDASKAEIALNFIKNKTKEIKQPWACYVGFHQPHPAFTALQKYWDMYYPNRVDMPNIPPDHQDNMHLVYQETQNFLRIAAPIPEDKIRKARAAYYGMITELDEYIGQLWNALEATDQLKNTIFIYTSDHGESLGENGLWSKANLYDSSARVPLVIAGPGITPGVTVDTAVGHVDVVATMLEWAGADKPEHLRGHSLIPMMNNKPGDHPGFAFSESHSAGICTGAYIIRKGDWKYHYMSYYDDMLFNIKEDPYELSNRINDPKFQTVKEELKSILFSLMDPDQMTLQAFDAQNKLLKEITDPRTEDELVELFQGRLGEGQARLIAKKIKENKIA